MTTRQKAISLIELIIVLIIIGIIAAVSIPVYQDYLQKAKVYEARILFTDFEQAIQDFTQDKNDFPPSLEVLNNFSTKAYYVTKVKYTPGDNPEIVMTLDGFQDSENTIAWKWITPDGKDGAWSCSHKDTESTTIKLKYLPKKCNVKH
jgi:prepilin-type N-terminal cleavage/methylation domain-containing protein